MAKKVTVTATVKWCTCDHKMQDATYGKYQRVHNALQGKYLGWRCTVCGTKKVG